MLRHLLISLSLGTFSCFAISQTLPSSNDVQGPVRLQQRQVPEIREDARSPEGANERRRTSDSGRQVYEPGEFERFVQRLVEPAQPGPDAALTQDLERGEVRFDPRTGERILVQPPRQPWQQIRRFGAELLTAADNEFPSEPSSLVPPDYLLTPGDEIALTLWGSVDADLRLRIDRSGRVTIPRVGPVMLAGVRYSDAPDVIRRRVAQVFRNFDLSVSLGQLRGIRVYVTGFVPKPGVYSVTSLSTLLQAVVQAGGPSAAGSFRQIELRRRGQAPIVFDLYDFLLRGDRSADQVLMADDVIHVGPVGTQVALIGSVNKPAIFELKAGETVADMLRMAGGFSAVADRSRLALERLSERTTVKVAEVTLPAEAGATLTHGDVLRAFSAVEVASPVQRQAKRVRIEGEVLRPGEYVLPADSSMADALQAAGGLTPAAYVFGTEFTRESVRLRQQENYDRALRDLEVDLSKAALTQRTATADEAASQNSRFNNTTRLVQTLRKFKPNGRIVLQLPPTGGELPDLALEDGDRILVPPRPTTVAVFGSVFNAGAYLYDPDRSLASYLARAGGPTRGADPGSTFVIRANGAVVSSRQARGWFGTGGVDDTVALPGDTVFVPEEIEKTTFIQNAKDWTQILGQLGLGIAAIKSLGE